MTQSKNEGKKLAVRIVKRINFLQIKFIGLSILSEIKF